MYRFLKKTQCISFQNIYLLPTQSSINRLPLCSFCNVQHRNVPSDIWFINKYYFRTTINDAEVRITVKKKSKIKRKYAELLEVTDQVTSNKKAAVKKLNASRLSFLVNQPDVTLDKLHKINNNSLHEKHNKRNINTSSTTDIKNYTATTEDKINVSTNIDMYDNLGNNLNEKNTIYEDFKETDIYDHGSFNKSPYISNIFNTEFIEEIEDNSRSISNICKDEIKDGSLKDKFNIKKMQYNKAKNIQKKIRNSRSKNQKQNMNSTNMNSQMILAEIDVCLSCKMLERVKKLLKFLMRRVNHESLTMNRNACNLLLNYYASDGNVMKFLQFYDLMINNSINPDPQTYVAVFELIGKITNTRHKADLFQKMQSDMIKNGISFHDIFNKSTFKLNQSKNILKTIKLFKPDYQPEYIKPHISYNCKLLNDIDKINSRKSPVEGALSLEQLRNSLKMQIEQETKFILPIESVEKFHPVDNDKFLHYKKKLTDLESSWKEIALKAFERNLKYLEQKELDLRPPKCVLHPFLKVLPKERYVNLILQEIRNLSQNSQSFTLSISLLSVNLGYSVFKEYEISIKEKNGILDKTIDIYNKYLNWYSQTGSFDTTETVNGRTVWNKLIYENQHHGASLDKENIQWPYHTVLNVGKFLYQIIINDIKINGDNQSKNSLIRQKPAFYTVFRNKGKFLVEQIKPHPSLCKLYKDAQSNTLTFEATLIPSLCPPRPWISINSGGYAFLKTNFVRIPYYARAKQIQLLENIPSSQLYPALDSLNQLGSIPWKVNTQVLDVLIKVFQEGGSVKLDVPQPPSSLSPADDLIENEDIKNNICISKTRLQLKKKKEEMYSLWCDCLYKLSLANHFRNHIFWLPHNLDFRGRVYPIPPHLTHLGSDLARSILIFAQGKPLGPDGLDWLKIHTVNLTGLKKRENLKERLKFANENIDKIIDSAENPLTGDMWWAESDEPWQTLASCMEIVKALKSPNAEKYISSFPVHQDGSCNGLQHYAALGRDQIGATSVNLQPTDTPQDVYSVVVNMVEDLRSKDAENGVLIAKILEGHITRKVIKQTVMTTVYGVTKYGARLQIMKQLKDLENFPKERCWEASTYLTYKTFDSLRTMFTSARTIQDWFTNCAYIISTIFDESIEWKTPLGFQVLQPYSKYSKSTTKTIEKIDTLKQKNSFPPNFIHSLDSSHMMLTSLFCERAGITFMSVHDCFWTHPCTIDTMNKICREQFVALHSEPILDDLSKYFHERYLGGSNSLLETFTTKEIENIINNFNYIPEKGSFNLNNVLKSVYFFS